MNAFREACDQFFADRTAQNYNDIQRAAAAYIKERGWPRRDRSKSELASAMMEQYHISREEG